MGLTYLVYFSLLFFLIVLLLKELCIFQVLKHKLSISPRVIVSFTTSPKRIFEIKPVIDSIKNQTVSVDYIFLNLPKIFKRDKTTFTLVPEYLINDPQVIINFCDDLGPATKIIPTIKSSFTVKSDILISIDDDTIYPPNFIETYLFYHSFYNGCVITGTSFAQDFSTKGKYFGSLTEAEVLEGFSGVLYKKEFLDDAPLEIFDKESVPEYHYLSDDLVLSNYVKGKGIKILCLGQTHPMVSKIRQLIFGFKEDALHKGASGVAKCPIGKDCNKINYAKVISYLQDKGDYHLNLTIPS